MEIWRSRFRITGRQVQCLAFGFRVWHYIVAIFLDFLYHSSRARPHVVRIQFLCRTSTCFTLGVLGHSRLCRCMGFRVWGQMNQATAILLRHMFLGSVILHVEADHCSWTPSRMTLFSARHQYIFFSIQPTDNRCPVLSIVQMKEMPGPRPSLASRS